MMRFTRTVPFICALTAVLALSASAQAAFTVGDIFAAVDGAGTVQRYNAAGAFQQNLSTGVSGFNTGMGFDGAGNLYVTNFSASSVSKFDSNGTNLGLFGSGYNTPESIVFDTAGNAYVGNTGSGILKFNAAGASLASFGNAGRVDWLDLSKDQKTMLYSREDGNIYRFDVSTGTPLSNFASGLSARFAALRILADGSVLAATQGNTVLQLDSSGNAIKTYTVAGAGALFALNIAPGASSFFTGDDTTGKIYQISLATGAILQTIDTGVGGNRLFGVAVFGEVTQGGPPPTVPEPATLTLTAFGIASLVGYRWRSRKKVPQ